MEKIGEILMRVGLQQMIFNHAIGMKAPGILHLREATIVQSYPAVEDARHHL